MIINKPKKFGGKYSEIQKINFEQSPEIYIVNEEPSKAYFLKLFRKDCNPKKFSYQVKIHRKLNKKENPFFLKYISDSDAELIIREKYIVLEFAEKGSLSNYISGGNFLNEKMAKIVSWIVFKAIMFIHELDIAYGRISIKNIYLDGNYNIKIGGLDSAKMLDNVNKNKIKEYYLKDISALGLLLIQLLTGKDLFDSSFGNANLVKKAISDIKKGNSKKFWEIIKMNSDYNFTLELKELIENMFAEKISDMREILNHSWFSEISALDQKEFEKYKEELKSEFKKMEMNENNGDN